MKFTPSKIPDVIIVEPVVFRDPRGFFMEFFNERKFQGGGIEAVFVQDNHSSSVRGTLRGLHAQREFPQAKLIRCIAGEIFDVSVDVRRGSPTFGQWVGITLSAENCKQVYIPEGFVHGFCVMSETAQVEYKVTDFYHPEDEFGVLWSDPELAIDWPLRDPILSEKDKTNKPLADIMDLLPPYEGGST